MGFVTANCSLLRLGILPAVWLMGIPNGVERPPSEPELQPQSVRPASIVDAVLTCLPPLTACPSCVRNLEAGWQRQDLFCSCFSCSQQSADRSTLEAVEHLPPPLAAKNPPPLLQVAVAPHLGRRSSFQVKPSLPRRSCKGCRVNGRPWRQS